ncbi:MAG: tyrosine protein phosphatase [Proteobacteria bacterium]|nr:tyrosine protein phosphatase [Pseudomonadota bacterium]MBU1058830.1 tyrosine protein phosphatase [Pseudomonadota bacterium]
MIDIHCHILPGIDDGSPDMKTSVQMAEMAAKDGIHTIIATPHLATIDYPKDRLLKGIHELNIEFEKATIPITVLFGAEVQAHIALAAGEDFCLAGSSSLLVEFPHSYLPADAEDLIYNLISNKINPIIAHPERNGQISREPWLLAPLLELGAKTQITAESITGDQGIMARNCAEYLLHRKQVHYIGTDSHSPGFRKPILSKAVKQAAKIIGKAEAQKLVSGYDILLPYSA